MMIDLFENNLVDISQPVYKNLAKIYGIGRKTSLKKIKLAGICKNQNFKNINPEKLEIISDEIHSSKLLIKHDLKKNLAKVYRDLIEIKSYRGLRRVKGYPARGQRTHSNAKNARKKRF